MAQHQQVNPLHRLRKKVLKLSVLTMLHSHLTEDFGRFREKLETFP